jgi:menaquinone-dependent protoporphyrinogen oxidase
MKILVAYASRMGSNAEIAQRIGQQLSGAGHDVDVSPCADAAAASDYDAVILGSALYMGRWDKAALRYLKAQSDLLAQRPAWLFQSGPCGEGFELEHVDTPRAVRTLSARIGLAPPVTFGGRLDRAKATTTLSRWMATGTYAGDFRDWDQVRAWTAEVMAQLAGGRSRAPLPAS